jgi:hypothetical protein
MIQYLEAKIAFRKTLAEVNPGHPDLPMIDEDIERTRRAVEDGNTQANTPEPEALTREFVEAEVERQAVSYREAEFARRLRMSPDRFKDSIMGLIAAQPQAWRGRFDLPRVVIGPKIPVGDQYKMLGLNYLLGGFQVSDWEEDPGGYKTPEVFRLVWMQDGRVNLNRSVDDVRSTMATDERGVTLHYGVGLFNADPDVLSHHFVAFPGTQVEPGSAPALDRWLDGPKVGANATHYKSPYFGAATYGR